MSDSVNIEGLDKAELLAALYNNARVQGFGALHATPEPMTAEQAANLLKDTDSSYFDYLNGRVMKVSIDKNAKVLDHWLYDRDNGQGSVQRVVDSLRAKGAA